jgi:hypothetical protein
VYRSDERRNWGGRTEQPAPDNVTLPAGPRSGVVFRPSSAGSVDTQPAVPYRLLTRVIAQIKRLGFPPPASDRSPYISTSGSVRGSLPSQSGSSCGPYLGPRTATRPSTPRCRGRTATTCRWRSSTRSRRSSSWRALLLHGAGSERGARKKRRTRRHHRRRGPEMVLDVQLQGRRQSSRRSDVWEAGTINKTPDLTFPDGNSFSSTSPRRM